MNVSKLLRHLERSIENRNDDSNTPFKLVQVNMNDTTEDLYAVVNPIKNAAFPQYL